MRKAISRNPRVQQTYMRLRKRLPQARRRAPALPTPIVFLNGEGPHPKGMWPAVPPPAYLGQLEPAFQARLAAERAWIEREDCDFYHTAVLRSGEVIPGAWDLRGSEEAYLGGLDIGRKRVLELGPASGYLTFAMEERGADVVGFDVGYDVSIDLLPQPGLDPYVARNDAVRYIAGVQNAWWYSHRDRASSAQVVYGNIYSMPGDMGAFDVAVFGAILIHLRDPYLAMAQAAARTKDYIVVTELLQDHESDPEDNVARFSPLASEDHTNWWSHTPGSIKRMLTRVGFEPGETVYHPCKHHLGHDLAKPPVDMPMFTIVGRRRD